VRLLPFVALALVLFGCAGMAGQSADHAEEVPASEVQPQSPDSGGADAAVAAAQAGMPDAAEGAQEAAEGTGETKNTGQETAAGASGQGSGKTKVLMLGRSVAYGWAEYMGLGWQEDESYLGDYEGKSIRYVQMDYPPDIDESAIRAMETYDFDVVFFKLCFVDFGSEYGDMLSDDKQYVENVYQEAVVKRKKKLIVGNALPQVSRDTTAGLKQNHEDYNAWLAQFASTHDGVYVLDLYKMLADGSGALSSGYASAYDDSHPNRAGYAKITPAFMDRIDEAAGAG
jgi:hypothetical protein